MLGCVFLCVLDDVADVDRFSRRIGVGCQRAEAGPRSVWAVFGMAAALHSLDPAGHCTFPLPLAPTTYVSLEWLWNHASLRGIAKVVVESPKLRWNHPSRP